MRHGRLALKQGTPGRQSSPQHGPIRKPAAKGGRGCGRAAHPRVTVDTEHHLPNEATTSEPVGRSSPTLGVKPQRRRRCSRPRWLFSHMSVRRRLFGRRQRRRPDAARRRNARGVADRWRFSRTRQEKHNFDLRVNDADAPNARCLCKARGQSASSAATLRPAIGWRASSLLRQSFLAKRHRAAVALRAQLAPAVPAGCDLRHRDEAVRSATVCVLVCHGRFLPGLGP